MISNDKILLKENKPNYTRGVLRKEYSQDLKSQFSNISKKVKQGIENKKGFNLKDIRFLFLKTPSISFPPNSKGTT